MKDIDQKGDVEGNVSFPEKRRSELSQEYPAGTVAVASSSPKDTDEKTGLPIGVGFLKHYKAWGFLQIAEQKAKYLALYINKPESKVKFFGKIDSIVDPRSPESPVSEPIEEEKYPESWNLGPHKKIILLDKNSIVKIKPPIELGGGSKGIIQGFWYTSLEKFSKASETADLQ